ncbi:MAG: hypothetical protein Kow00121_06840 [Elainellaceae cyanobacterium]
MNMGQWISLLCIKGMGILLASAGGVFLAKIPSFYESEVDFQSKAISAIGTVTETRDKKEQRYYYSGGIPIPATTTKLISTVEFQTNQGELIKFTTSKACSSRHNCENKSVPVLYDPNFPTDARVDFENTPIGGVIAGLILGSSCLLLGVPLILAKPDDRNANPARHHS